MAVNIAKTMEAQKLNNVLPVSIQPTAWRVEIDEFLADTKMTNLFLLALEKMQKDGLGMLDAKELEIKKADLGPLENKDKINWWTFYNLSGIHFYPQENWNGVTDRLPKEYEIGYGNGYCRHGSIVFPTWHRAYIYQFEQAVYNQMRALADQFKGAAGEKRKYQDAAKRFRLPFWDPFMPRNKLQPNSDRKTIWGMPEILSVEKVWVRRPEDPDKLIDIANPLASFAFPSEDDCKKAGRKMIDWDRVGMIPWRDPVTKKITTVRSPRGGPSNYDDLNETIQDQAQNIATKVWHMLNPDFDGSDDTVGSDKERNQARTWETFSNHKASDDNRTISIESWHDGIHGLVGSGRGNSGQMAWPEVAGFDPIFWLHHCNIDRLFALYQALYPEKYVAQEDEVNKKGVNASSPLYPFSKGSGSFWNSNDLRDWKKTGFAMPGTADLDEDSREIIKEYVRNNYYWMTDGTQPPESLKYPKNLEHVEALRGLKAKRLEEETVTVDALEVTVNAAGQAPAAQFVEKTLVLSEGQEVVITPKDTAAGAAEQVENEKRFPEGALQNVADPTPTKMVTWNAHVKIKKYAFNGSFNIHFFIGRVNDQDPGEFMVRKNEVGFSGIFASPIEAECANCNQQRAANFMYEDVVPITSTLVDYLQANPKSKGLIREGEIKTIENLGHESVVPFLREHLQWRIADTSANLISDEPRIKDSDLEVKVISRMFETPSEENKLGVYSDPVLHQEITETKAGGYGYVWP